MDTKPSPNRGSANDIALSGQKFKPKGMQSRSALVPSGASAVL